MTSELPGALCELATRPDVAIVRDAFARTGHHLAVVGGAVRDALLGVSRPDMDIDLTTDADVDTIERLLEPLGPVWTAGKSFGTIAVAVSTSLGVSKVEVTTWRTDTYDASSRKPDVSRAVSLVEDLERRDATVNAMALDLATNDGGPAKLIDPFGGRADLEARILRTPGDPDRCFTDDPLRIVRLVRFAARLGAVPHPATLAAARRQAGRLSVVSSERIEAELDSLATCSPQVVAGALRLFASIGVVDAVLGTSSTSMNAANELAGVMAGVLDRLDAEPRIAHVHDIVVSLFAPGVRSQRPLPTSRVRRAEAAVNAATASSSGSLVDVFRLLRRAGEPTVSGLRVAAAAGNASAAVALAAVEQRLAAHPTFITERLPVDGNDLLAAGLTGRAVGVALAAVEEAFCVDPTLSKQEALRLAV